MKIQDGLLHTNTEIIPVSKIQACGIVSRNTAWDFDSRKKVFLFMFWPLIAGVTIGLVAPRWLPFVADMDSYRYGRSVEWPLRPIIGGFWGFIANIPWWIVMTGFAPKLKEYAVKIDLDSGVTQLFWTTDRAFADKVAEVLSRAMGGSAVRPNVTINVEKQEIIDNSTTTLHNYGTFNVEISNSAGLSKEDMDFMMGTFQQGMRELAAEIEANGNKAVQAALQQVQAAVNAPQPEAGMIKRAYAHLKSVAEGVGVFENVLKVSPLVAQAALIFTN